VKRSLIAASTLVLFATCAAFAQSSNDSSSSDTAMPPAATQRPLMQNAPSAGGPFSRMAIGGGMSPLGVGMEVSTNVNEHLNVRGIGNIFRYSTSFTVSGVPSSANLNLASGGALLDYYPFHAGFRLSGGVLFVNQNQLSATAAIKGGDSFTLNDQTYYSSSANPLNGSGHLALNATRPSAMVTTGWGNHVKQSGHWTVPFEIGVAFVGAPQVNMTLTGVTCTDASQTQCANINDPNNSVAVQFQTNLNAQIAKWNSDLNVLKVYPVISTGIAYSFNIRR
jgi:hypothetical protein